MAPTKHVAADAAVKECRNNLVKYDVDLNKLLDGIIVSPSNKDVNSLLQKSRKLFADAENDMDSMESISLRLGNPREIDTTQTEVAERRKQFKLLNQEIRNAVAQRLAILDKQQRSELLQDNVLRSPSAIESEPGARKLMGQEEILKGNSQLTENLSRIARNVQQEILQGAETNKTLATSSETLSRTTDEFQIMGSTIQQGSHLIDKYDRRQFTDKVIITLAFMFFFAVCAYIVNKRLFGGFNWLSFLVEFFFANEPDLTLKEL